MLFLGLDSVPNVKSGRVHFLCGDFGVSLSFIFNLINSDLLTYAWFTIHSDYADHIFSLHRVCTYIKRIFFIIPFLFNFLLKKYFIFNPCLINKDGDNCILCSVKCVV